METITSDSSALSKSNVRLKRPRKTRAYKSELKNLQKRHKILKGLALAGWLAFLIVALFSSCTPVVINGVRVNQKASTKVDPETRFYGTAAFLIGAGLTTHFYHKDR